MYKKIVLLALLCATLGAGSAMAQDYGITLRAGTTGPGIALTRSFGKHFSLSLGGNYMPYTYNGSANVNTGSSGSNTQTNIAISAKLHMQSFSAMIDYQPFDNWLRISAGVYYNDFKVTANANPTNSYTVDGHVFSPQKVGSITGSVSYPNKLAPYIGLGIGNAANNRHHIGFLIDGGVMYTNAASVSMTGTGLIGPTAGQASNINQGLSGIKIYPVLTFGLSYRFLGH